MGTIENVMYQLTNAQSIMQDMKDMLREIDPEFPDEEAKYLQASEALERELGDSISPSVSEYLSALEEAYSSEVVYIGWQGFVLNLKVFNNPVNALLLRGDYENLHRQNGLDMIPAVKEARQTINAFYEALKNLPGDKFSMTEAISGFYAYLEITGCKIAHYFGFRLADSFLYRVVPGYYDDSTSTGVYAMELQEYLQVDLKRVE